MPTFLHAADLHIDSPLRGLGEQLGPRVREATRTAFRNLVDRALALRVSFVVIAGDIFDDEHQAIATARFIADELRRLDAAGIPVVLVRGNHDHLAKGAQAFWPAHVHELGARAPETIRLEALRVAVHGQSFPERHVRRDLTRDYPAPIPGFLNVGLLHTALEGHAGGHAAYAPTTLSALEARGYGYWALGHVHAHAALSQGGAEIVYPGNLQGRHARETGPKGAVLATWEGTKVTKVEHLPLDVVRWRVGTVEAADAPSFLEQARSVAERLQPMLQRDLDAGVDLAVRLTVRGVRPELLAEPRPRLEYLVQEAIHGHFDDRVMLEDLVLEPASASSALPAVLLGHLDEARSNLAEAGASDLARVSGELWRKVTESRVEELARELASRAGISAATDLQSRALLLGRQKLEALLAKG